jgi:tRNA-2-methylthio-N6-dimethylallyladenosine synthase
MKKKVLIKTYGCQMNAYDSSRMLDVIKPIGYEETSQIEEADLVVLNTCAIREKATEKVYSELGRIKKFKDKNKKKFLIAVAGCVSQAEGDQIFKRAHYVDIVVGPQSYHDLPRLIANAEEGKKHVIELDFIEEKKFDQLPEEFSAQGASSFVSIQEGCDKFCTFCVVPYTRGAEFSRPVEQIYREVLQMLSKGAKEIVLLGQNVNGYHGKSPDGDEVGLAFLIKHIAKIKQLERIRYTTSHPIDMSDDLIELHGGEDKLMPFLHLPVQSGSNKILKMMNRKYTKEHYIEIIDKLKIIKPDLYFSSDLIVGFPGETDEDFQDTMDLVDKIGYAQAYSYKYSPRPGTPAAEKEQIPERIKTERLIALQTKIQEHQFAFNRKFIGSTMPVLFDKDGKFNNQIIGKTPYMQSVYVSDAEQNLYGQIVDVKITDAFLNSLTGQVVDKNIAA